MINKVWFKPLEAENIRHQELLTDRFVVREAVEAERVQIVAQHEPGGWDYAVELLQRGCLVKKVKKRTGARSSKKAKRRQYDLSKGIDTRTAPSHQQLLSVMESLDAETETVIVEEMIHLRVTTLNINGLDKMKLDVVAWYAATTKSDIMYLVDTHLLQKEKDCMKKLFEEKLQKYSGERWKVLYNAAGPANATV